MEEFHQFLIFYIILFKKGVLQNEEIRSNGHPFNDSG